jgi:hypothetical protein
VATAARAVERRRLAAADGQGMMAGHEPAWKGGRDGSLVEWCRRRRGGTRSRTRRRRAATASLRSYGPAANWYRMAHTAEDTFLILFLIPCIPNLFTPSALRSFHDGTKPP